MGRYWGAYCTILAQASGRQFCVSRLWLVDCMAGAGLHVSRDHPDGVRPGTPLQAVRAARAAQTRFPGLEVTVHAIDIEPMFVEQLEERLRVYRGRPPAGVRIRLRQADFAARVPAILQEIRESTDHQHSSAAWRGAPHQHRSLWFVDPYGVRDIPHASLEPLSPRDRACEVVINLDVGGLWRVSEAAETVLESKSEPAVADSVTDSRVTVGRFTLKSPALPGGC